MPDVDDVTGRLKNAMSAVESAQLPEALQAEALRLAFEALGPTSSPPDTNPTDTSKDSVKELPATQGSMTSDDFFSRLSKNADVDEEDLRDAFFFNGGKPGINLRPAELGANTKARAQTLTVLLAGAYTLGLGSTLSSTTVIEEAKRLQVFDSGNHSASVRELRTWLSYGGAGRIKEIRLKPAGEDEFRKRLLGDE